MHLASTYFSFFSSSRSTGLICPAPTVPSSLLSMQSRQAKIYSGWCSPPSSPPCPTLTPAPTHTAITWPTGRGCWGTTRWHGPVSSVPSGTPGSGARGMSRWGTWDDNVRVAGQQKYQEGSFLIHFSLVLFYYVSKFSDSVSLQFCSSPGVWTFSNLGS